MATDAEPVVGDWYQQLDKGQKFQVVAVSEDDGVVQMQHFDGDIEEIDIDAWYEMDLKPIAIPEDWTSPLDEVETDEDLDYTETKLNKNEWDADTDEWEEDDDDSDRWEEESWNGGFDSEEN